MHADDGRFTVHMDDGHNKEVDERSTLDDGYKKNLIDAGRWTLFCLILSVPSGSSSSVSQTDKKTVP